MKHSIFLFFSSLLFLAAVSVQAGEKIVVEVDVTKGSSVEKSIEIVTYDENRFRIDLPVDTKEVTAETPYIMSVDNGENWVIGDKPKDRFYCSQMQTDVFFKNLGAQVTSAIDFFNVKTDAPTVKKIFEKPGPEIEGLKTTHLRLETDARAYARIFFIKFEYSAKVTDDIWYTTEAEIHPVKKKWMDALSQSGNNLIDQLTEGFTSNLPGPILKRESVVDITDMRKNETKTEVITSNIIDVTELDKAELDKVFQLPECEAMDDDEVQEKAKALFSAGKIML